MLILRIWKIQPGKFFFISTKSSTGKWEDHAFKRNQFKEVERFIEENHDKDVYWCPHGFNRPRRLKPYAEIPKLLWADLDEADPREIDPMPTIAWESSPGRYCGIWMVDEYITEDINRRLTYLINADRGGWDFTQVLRVPNTTNYKYQSLPRVRLLWSDGPSYKLRDILRKLPKEEKKAIKSGSAKDIYRKYQTKFSGFIRRELLRGRPKHGKRSEVLWKLVHGIIEAGCTEEEAFELLRVSPWNKFKNRRNGDEQLKREIDKVISLHLHVVDEPGDPIYGEDEEDSDEDEDDNEEYRFLARSMDEVEEENIDWLWYPYLAKGELTILEGDPGQGKSYLAQIISSYVCDGKIPPGKQKKAMEQGPVAYFDIENSAGSVTKKRLKSNGCRVLKNFYQEEEPFSVDDDDRFEQVLEAIDQLRPKLVVFDTVNTYIGGADTHKSSEVQQAFANFLNIARRFHCSVLVLRHLTKSSKERAIYRGQGSIAFTGLARVVITVGSMPEEEDTRVMAVTKLNVAKLPQALTFRIRPLPPKKGDRERSRFIWGKFVDISSDQIVSQVSDEKSKAERANRMNAAWKLLKDLLEDGPKTEVNVRRAAEAASIKFSLIKEVAIENDVVFSKSPSATSRQWSLAKK